VQLVGYKFVRTRQLHRKCTISNIWTVFYS